IEQKLTSIAAALDALRATNGPLGRALPDLVKSGQSTTAWYSSLKQALRIAIQALGQAATSDLTSLLNLASDLIGGIFGLDDASRLKAEIRVANTAIQLSLALETLGASTSQLVSLRQNLQSALPSNDRAVIAGARIALQGEIQ